MAPPTARSCAPPATPEKPQCRDRAVHRWRLHALLTLMHLIKAQIFTLRLIRRAAEEECEVPNVADIVALRLLSEAADGHVLNHAALRPRRSCPLASG